MGSKKNVSVDGATDHVKIVSADTAKEAELIASVDVDKKEGKKAKKATKVNARSANYRRVRALVDRNKFYSPTEALDLVKKSSYSQFVGTVSADLILKDTNNQITVAFPHSTGKSLRVAIVDDDLIAQITDGKIDFDVLLTTPQYMPKLARLARILGPKGLMPNPKNNTIVQDPEKAKAELLSGKTVLKTERKAPLLHATIGKANMTTKELVENLQALLQANDGKVLKCVVSSTMSPGVKVDLSKEA
ncbi:50S ribosomal protein L1 [bacterium]|nr:50S ribosomal protein L1 [bacterium]MBQ6436731.1 50S ribosomal protein L1 [bacterium]